MTSAAFSQRAVDYDLHLSFLLNGGRGIGKFTVASWVAESLGLHLFEVSFFKFYISCFSQIKWTFSSTAMIS